MTQCQYLIDLPYGQVKQCQRRATRSVTYAPYGTASPERETTLSCVQHAKMRHQWLLVKNEAIRPDPDGQEIRRLAMETGKVGGQR